MKNSQYLAESNRLEMTMASSMKDLSLEANDLLMLTGENPVEMDEYYLANFVTRLERAPILSLVDLVAADNILELMYAPRLRRLPAYAALLAKARRFIAHYPQLLEMGWLHCQGCIAELIDEMRADTSDAHRVLARYWR